MYLLEIYVYQIDKQKHTKRYQTNLKTRQISFCDVHDEWGILGRVHSLLQRCVQIPFSYHVDQRLCCSERGPGAERAARRTGTSLEVEDQFKSGLKLFHVFGYLRQGGTSQLYTLQGERLHSPSCILIWVQSKALNACKAQYYLSIPFQMQS